MTNLHLSGHEIMATYYELRLQAQGVQLRSDPPASRLNRQTHKRWNTLQWLTVIEPHFLRMTGAA
jgi:hypothetical protein